MNNLSRLLMSSALCTVCTIASAQQVNVNGIVKDAAGETVIGASVMVKGTNDSLTGSILYDAIYIYLLCTNHGANRTERRAHQ